MSLHRFKKIGFAGVFTVIFSILLQFVILPPIMRVEMKKKVALKKGWPMRDIWSKLPFVTESHMYVFNVTNRVEIENGGKPIIQEIGPFVYDIYEEKTQQIDHEEDDTVSYVLENIYHFNPEKSKGLSVEIEVYFPHTYIMTASTGILKEKAPLASFASRSVDSLLNTPESLFYKTDVKTLLFDGFPIPCAGVEEFFGKLTCNLLKERFFDFTVMKKGDVFYTSMFGFLNGTYEKQNRVRIHRGTKNLKDLGKIVAINGAANLSTWHDDKCDALGGTDGTIFPPYLSKSDDITMVNQQICRRLKLTYDSEVEYSGLKLLRYTVDLGVDGGHVAEEKCYCLAPDRCLRKGVYDMFRCLNVPIILSNPHFYLADPYYLSRVEGAKPDMEKHRSYVDFDALTGTPVRARMRAQFNMELIKIDAFRLMRNYSYAMLPMVWTEQVVVLPDFLVEKIRQGHGTLKLARSRKVAEVRSKPAESTSTPE
ncbi:sensory neuron membrane protein 1-like isoform X2 [Phymastichus coffea]|uniref:sensory neuron membrane protein 1-like isoform X2 n=1 Tax=Phymastichus coffea TaxID=108790 RepID=UPI00273CC999|nr:sensory neuron membrane protein 1-like isoform X2 [Phymastichus coffea]